MDNLYLLQRDDIFLLSIHVHNHTHTYLDIATTPFHCILMYIAQGVNLHSLLDAIVQLGVDVSLQLMYECMYVYDLMHRMDILHQLHVKFSLKYQLPIHEDSPLDMC